MYFSLSFKKASTALIVGALCVLLVSCKGESIDITQNNLDKSLVTLIQGEKIVSKDNFLRFNFTVSKPLLEIAPIKSLFQVRATINKGDKIIFKDIASGPFLVANTGSRHTDSNLGYSAYIFKSLAVNQGDGEKSIAIIALDYDTLTLVVIYPEMGTGIKHSSKQFTYSKNRVNDAISQKTGEVTLLMP